MPFIRLLIMVAAGTLLAVTAQADEARLVTADDFIETLSKPTSAHEGLPDSADGSQKPRFRLRGISAATRPPEVAINIFFKSGTVEVADDFSKKQMAEAGKALSSEILRPYRFEIAGHTDSVGSEAYNRDLSEKRARALKQYLMDQYSVAEHRLETIGYGESQPVADNNTEQGRARNRRVVFKRLD